MQFDFIVSEVPNSIEETKHERDTKSNVQWKDKIPQRQGSEVYLYFKTVLLRFIACIFGSLNIAF